MINGQWIRIFHSDHHRGDSLFFYLRVYFALCLVNLFAYTNWRMRTFAFSGADWLWPVLWMKKIPPEVGFVGLWLFTIFFILLAALKPLNRPIKVITLLCLFLFTSAFYSFGKIDHVLHGWLFATLFLVFIGPSTVKSTSQRWFALQSAQAAFLFIYFLTGLWKLRHFIVSAHSQGLERVSETLPFQLAQHSLHSTELSAMARALIDLPSTITLLLWLGVIFIECGAILPIFQPKLKFLWGILIILLHGAIDVTMGINYTSHAILAAILLIGAPTPRSSLHSISQERIK